MKSCLIVLLVSLIITSCEAKDDAFPGLPFEKHDYQSKLFSGKIEDAFGEYSELLSVLSIEEKKVIGNWIDYDRMDREVTMHGVYPSVNCEMEVYPNHVIKLYGSKFLRNGDEVFYRLINCYGLWQVRNGVLSADFYSMRYGPDSRNLLGYSFKQPIHWEIIKVADISDRNYTTKRISEFPTSNEFTAITGIPKQTYRWFMYRMLSEWDNEAFFSVYPLSQPMEDMLQSGLDPLQIVSDDEVIRKIWY